MFLNHLQSIDFRNAILEARNEAPPDGKVVVDQKGKIVLHNQNFTNIWKMPHEIVDKNDDKAALQHVVSMVAYQEGFIRRVQVCRQTHEQPDRRPAALFLHY